MQNLIPYQPITHSVEDFILKDSYLLRNYQLSFQINGGQRFNCPPLIEVIDWI